MSIQYFSLSFIKLHTMNNLTFDIILFMEYTFRNAIFEYIKKWCCEQRSTLPGKGHENESYCILELC